MSRFKLLFLVGILGLTLLGGCKKQKTATEEATPAPADTAAAVPDTTTK